MADHTGEWVLDTMCWGFLRSEDGLTKKIDDMSKEDMRFYLDYVGREDLDGLLEHIRFTRPTLHPWALGILHTNHKTGSVYDTGRLGRPRSNVSEAARAPPKSDLDSSRWSFNGETFVFSHPMFNGACVVTDLPDDLLYSALSSVDAQTRQKIYSFLARTDLDIAIVAQAWFEPHMSVDDIENELRRAEGQQMREVKMQQMLKGEETAKLASRSDQVQKTTPHTPQNRLNATPQRPTASDPPSSSALGNAASPSPLQAVSTSLMLDLDTQEIRRLSQPGASDRGKKMNTRVQGTPDRPRDVPQAVRRYWNEALGFDSRTITDDGANGKKKATPSRGEEQHLMPYFRSPTRDVGNFVVPDYIRPEFRPVWISARSGEPNGHLESGGHRIPVNIRMDDVLLGSALLSKLPGKDVDLLYPFDFATDDFPFGDRACVGTPFRPRLLHRDLPRNGQMVPDDRIAYFVIPSSSKATKGSPASILYLGGEDFQPSQITDQMYREHHKHFIEIRRGNVSGGGWDALLPFSDHPKVVESGNSKPAAAAVTRHRRRHPKPRSVVSSTHSANSRHKQTSQTLARPEQQQSPLQQPLTGQTASSLEPVSGATVVGSPMTAPPAPAASGSGPNTTAVVPPKSATPQPFSTPPKTWQTDVERFQQQLPELPVLEDSTLYAPAPERRSDLSTLSGLALGVHSLRRPADRFEEAQRFQECVPGRRSTVSDLSSALRSHPASFWNTAMTHAGVYDGVLGGLLGSHKLLIGDFDHLLRSLDNGLNELAIAAGELEAVHGPSWDAHIPGFKSAGTILNQARNQLLGMRDTHDTSTSYLSRALHGIHSPGTLLGVVEGVARGETNLSDFKTASAHTKLYGLPQLPIDSHKSRRHWRSRLTPTETGYTLPRPEIRYFSSKPVIPRKRPAETPATAEPVSKRRTETSRTFEDDALPQTDLPAQGQRSAESKQSISDRADPEPAVATQSNKSLPQLPQHTELQSNEPLLQLPRRNDLQSNKSLPQLPQHTELQSNKSLPQLPQHTELQPNEPLLQLPRRTELQPNEPLLQLPRRTDLQPNEPLLQFPRRTDLQPEDYRELSSRSESQIEGSRPQIPRRAGPESSTETNLEANNRVMQVPDNNSGPSRVHEQANSPVAPVMSPTASLNPVLTGESATSVVDVRYTYIYTARFGRDDLRSACQIFGLKTSSANNTMLKTINNWLMAHPGRVEDCEGWSDYVTRYANGEEDMDYESSVYDDPLAEN